MKIWSSILTTSNVECAAEQVNQDFPGCDVFLGSSTSWSGSGDQVMELYEGPRTRRIDGVHLRTRHGGRLPNAGTHGGDMWSSQNAASWTEWGWFLTRVYVMDPDARCGQYHGVADFHRQTNFRFIDPATPRGRQIRPRMQAENENEARFVG